MNRGFLIILFPAFLVAIGYFVIFRYLCVTASYVTLTGAMIVLFGGMWWFGRRYRRKPVPQAAVRKID
jgi:hypothetical protein